IRDQQIVRMQAQLGQRLLSVLDGVDRESFEREELREDLANHALVVDDEDPCGLGRLRRQSTYCGAGVGVTGAGGGVGGDVPTVVGVGAGAIGSGKCDGTPLAWSAACCCWFHFSRALVALPFSFSAFSRADAARLLRSA